MSQRTLAPAAARQPATRDHAGRRFASAACATLLGLVFAAAVQARDAAEVDLGVERLSRDGAFRVSYQSEPRQIPINRLHAWTLRVTTADGEPVTDAHIAVAGDMPEHGHGLPTRPRVTRNLGNGEYLVEGVRFQMGGWWVMDFIIDAGGRSDVARFNLMLSHR